MDVATKPNRKKQSKSSERVTAKMHSTVNSRRLQD